MSVRLESLVMNSTNGSNMSDGDLCHGNPHESWTSETVTDVVILSGPTTLRTLTHADLRTGCWAPIIEHSLMRTYIFLVPQIASDVSTRMNLGRRDQPKWLTVPRALIAIEAEGLERLCLVQPQFRRIDGIAKTLA